MVQNTEDTHHRCRLLHRFSVLMMVFGGYKEKTATEEDIHSDLANSLPLETLRRGAAMRH